MKTSYGSGLFGGQKTITNASDENSSEESQVGAANIFNGAQKPPAAPAPKQEQSFAQMQSAGYARPAPMPFTGPSAPRQVDDDDEEELARRVRAQLAQQQGLGVQQAASALPVLRDMGGLMAGGATEGFRPPMTLPPNAFVPASGGAPPSDGMVPTAPTAAPDDPNSVRGYTGAGGMWDGVKVSPQQFALKSLQQTTGIDPAKMGLSESSSLQEVQSAQQLMASIANGSSAAMQQGLQSSNPFIKQTAQAYLSGQGASGFDQGAWNQYQANTTKPASGLSDAVKNALGGGETSAGVTQSQAPAANASSGGQGAAPAQSSAPAQAQAQAPSQPQAQPQAQAQAQPQAQVQPSSGLNSELERRVQEAMSAPGRYDEATVKNLRAQQRAELDASFAGQLRAEKERLAQRGLAASSIGFEKESGLAGQQARAIAQMEGDLTTRVADAMAQDRQAAIANAMGLRSQTSQEGQFGQQLANQQNQFGQQLGLDTRRQSAQESQFGQQLASQESQFGKQLGLDERKVTEATRQFNANLSAESDRFAKSHGLDAERFRASNDQFQQNLAMQKDQFGQQISYNKAQLAQQAEQFGKTYGLDLAAQKEIARQWQAKFDVSEQDRFLAFVAQFPADASPEAIAAAMRGAGFDPEKYKDFLKPKSSTPASTPTPTPAPTPTPNTPVGSGSGSTTIDDYYDYMNRNNV